MMNEKSPRRPQPVDDEGLKAFRDQLIAAAKTPAAAEAVSEVAQAAPQVAEATPVDDKTTSASEKPAKLDYLQVIERRAVIRTYTQPIYVARNSLSTRDDMPKGVSRKEWFAAAKPLLAAAGYPVGEGMSQNDFFDKFNSLQAEYKELGILKDQLKAERAAREARAPRKRATPPVVPTDTTATTAQKPKKDRQQAKSSKLPKIVTQGRLDELEDRTQVWGIDRHEYDIVARERARHAASRTSRTADTAKTAKTADNTSHTVSTAAASKTEAARTYLEKIDTMRDLVTVDDVNGVHIPKGSGRLSGRYMSEYQIDSVADHADQIRDGLAERAEEIAFLERAKAFIPALDAIDSALEAVDMNEGDKVQSAIRRALVASGVYGTDTARQIGNMPNDELLRLLDFARGAAAQRGSAHPTALPPEEYGPDTGAASAHPTALPPEAYGPDAGEPGASAHPTALPPEAYGPDTDDLDIFGTHHPTALPPEAYGPDTERGAELDATIGEARNRYAQLTAKDRTSYFGRFLKSDTKFSRFLRRIPGVGRATDSINARQSHDKDEAQAEYEALINGIAAEITADTAEQQLAHRKAWMINESLALEQAVADYTKDLSKDAGALTNWWMSQEGKRFERTKKAAVIAVGGAAAAATATIFLPSMMFGLATGSVVGGITGGYMAHRITKRRNNADIKVGRNATMSHADYEAAYSMNNQFDALSANGDASAASMTSIVENKSYTEMLRNRKRVGTAKGIGAVAGGLTGLGIGRLHELWDSHSQAANEAQTAVEKADAARQAAEEKAKALQEQLTEQANAGGAENADAASAVDSTATTATNGGIETLQGNSFTVEYGNGFIKEWGQWAELNGHKIDGQTAEQLHQAVINKFGTQGVIDLDSLPTNAETYIKNGDLRIGAPGSAQWQPGVADFARDWLKSQGKW